MPPYLHPQFLHNQKERTSQHHQQGKNRRHKPSPQWMLQGATSQSIDGELCVLFPWLYCLGSLHKCNMRLLGNVCESVPLDRTGSYVSISMENTMYINNYNTCSFVVQVDASLLLSISELVTSVVLSWFLLV